MHRLRATGVALLTLVALAVAACGGSTASPISDPNQILTSSAEAVQSAKSVHVKVDLSGKVQVGDLSGLLGGLNGIPGASGGASPSAAAAPSGSPLGLDITGTTVEGDIDIANKAAHISFTAPSLLGLTADLIVVDGTAYVKASLLGDKYQKLSPTESSGASPAPTASPSPTAGLVDSLRTALGQLKTPPTKLADEQCGDTKCYHVQVKLDPSMASGLESMAPELASLAPNMAGTTGTLDVYVRQNDLLPSQIVLAGTGGPASGLTVTVTFSDWNKSVSIQAPPADQVQTGGSGLFPSFALPSFAAPSPSA